MIHRRNIIRYIFLRFVWNQIPSSLLLFYQNIEYIAGYKIGTCRSAINQLHLMDVLLLGKCRGPIGILSLQQSLLGLFHRKGGIISQFGQIIHFREKDTGDSTIGSEGKTSEVKGISQKLFQRIITAFIYVKAIGFLHIGVYPTAIDPYRRRFHAKISAVMLQHIFGKFRDLLQRRIVIGIQLLRYRDCRLKMDLGRHIHRN